MTKPIGDALLAELDDRIENGLTHLVPAEGWRALRERLRVAERERNRAHVVIKAAELFINDTGAIGFARAAEHRERIEQAVKAYRDAIGGKS